MTILWSHYRDEKGTPFEVRGELARPRLNANAGWILCVRELTYNGPLRWLVLHCFFYGRGAELKRSLIDATYELEKAKNIGEKFLLERAEEALEYRRLEEQILKVPPECNDHPLVRAEKDREREDAAKATPPEGPEAFQDLYNFFALRCRTQD